MSERGRFTLPLTCPHCGAEGAVAWEENTQMSAQGLQRSLVSVQGAFHAEAGRSNSGDPLIVCNSCDQIMPD